MNLHDKTKLQGILNYLNCSLITQAVFPSGPRGKTLEQGVYVQIMHRNSNFDFLYWVLSIYGDKRKLVDMVLMTKETEFKYLLDEGLLEMDPGKTSALFYHPPDNLRYVELLRGSDPDSGVDRDISQHIGKFVKWIDDATFAKGLRASALNVKRLLKNLSAERLAQKDEVLSLLSRPNED